MKVCRITSLGCVVCVFYTLVFRVLRQFFQWYLMFWQQNICSPNLDQCSTSLFTIQWLQSLLYNKNKIPKIQLYIMEKNTHTKNLIKQEYMILIKFRTVFSVSLIQKFRYTVPVLICRNIRHSVNKLLTFPGYRERLFLILSHVEVQLSFTKYIQWYQSTFALRKGSYSFISISDSCRSTSLHIRVFTFRSRLT